MGDEIEKKRITLKELEDEGLARIHTIKGTGSGVKEHRFAEFKAARRFAKQPTYHGTSRDGDEWIWGAAENRAGLEEAIHKGKVPERIWNEFKKVRDQLGPAIQEFAGVGQTTRRKRVRGEVGIELDIARYVGRNPEHWVSRPRGRKKRLVRIGVQTVYAAGTGEEVFIRNGALASAAAELLTRVGLAVEVVAIGCTVTRGGDGGGASSGLETVYSVPLKEAHEKLDHSKLLLTALTGFSRNYGFCTLEALGNNPSDSYAASPSEVASKYLNITALLSHKLDFQLHQSGGGFSHDADIIGFFNKASEVLRSSGKGRRPPR